MAHPTRIMYVEKKSGLGGGPAWIGRVHFSKTGRTIYYRGLTLRRKPGKTWSGGNYVDVDTGDAYWVSGVHKDGQDRHPVEWQGPVEVDPDVLDEYKAMVRPEVAAKIR